MTDDTRPGLAELAAAAPSYVIDMARQMGALAHLGGMPLTAGLLELAALMAEREASDGR